MLFTRKAAAVWLSLAFERVLTAQTPLSSHAPSSFYPVVENDLGQWNLDEGPAVNTTGHLVFETANSLLQHWANTRHRIGHTIIPGTIPVGTHLYHGALTGPHLPTALDWVAVEPDHSKLFCKGSIETGCWHLTLAVTRPMKVLYFDGNSAAKLSGGTMDTQDLVAWSEMKPEWLWNEEQRIKDLCKWGEKYGVNGFVRMEMNFEIMICNFTSHMEIVSFLNLESIRIGTSTDPPPVGPHTGERLCSVFDVGLIYYRTSVYHVFELLHSASWRENYPGETRIMLDFSGLVSFYDTALVPSLVPRRVGLDRWDHRVAAISSEDIERVQDRLAQALALPPATTSGIDWKTVLRVVVDRYASRLEFIQHLLNLTLDDGSIFDHAQQIQRQLRAVLLPYTVFAALPPNTSVTANATNSWAAPVFRECAASHAASIAYRGTALTPSEHLLLQAVRETTHEICRVVTKMWASGMNFGVDAFYPPEQRPEVHHIHTLMGEWKEDVTQLISWLDWSVCAKCRPACGLEEMCYLPTWPFGFPTAGAPLQAQWDSASLWPDPNKGEWKRPQPKCIRRREPYGL
ncbi:uncharacterized protein HD556DRAFT_1276906 [Suillus plorans]|uniref:Uncharacterized protein n=1 Tax=Suillus plorans TaxID=116603 RepID=A0A9P7AGP9_9AGAM|nr:uncharacterized protein HD556DRAFT_1276906 [Suillus plorans]KAG1787940.1 hypothetical protein HD556DRAFT_1276906 [Suillus plorans]